MKVSEQSPSLQCLRTSWLGLWHAQMKQKQEAIASLQSKMEAANTVGDDNTARIATLQVTDMLAPLWFLWKPPAFSLRHDGLSWVMKCVMQRRMF